MAYTREINRSCWMGVCTRQPRVEVIGSKNQTYGEYCRPCGNRRVRELNRQEREEFNAPGGV